MLIQYSAVSMILFKYGETKNTKKLLSSITTLAFIMYFTHMGINFMNIWNRDTVQFSLEEEMILLHFLFSFISFITLIIYIYKNKYYVWPIILPMLSYIFFLILDNFNLYHYFSSYH